MKHGRSRRNKKDRRRHKTLLKRVAVTAFCISVIVAAAMIFVYLVRLYTATDSSYVSVSVQNGTMSIIWDTSFEKDACRVDRYDEDTREYVFCGQYPSDLIMIDSIELEDVIKLRLQAVQSVELFGRKIEFSRFSRELTINPADIADLELSLSVDPANRTASIDWQGGNADSAYEIYFFDGYGNRELYSETQDTAVRFDFANDMTLPDRDAPLRVAVRAVRREKDYVLYGPMSDGMVIMRTDLLENDLALCYEQIDERQYELSWQECHGNLYEVQQWSDEEGQWLGKGVFDWAGHMTYQTGHLPSNAQVRFRVVTYDTVAERDREEWEAEPSEVTFHTGMSPLYCTIWPIVPLKITDATQGGNILGEVPAGEALCVLEENGNYFKILYRDCIGYVDSRFCMINLPEYMGDLCEYDITNSISSIFRVHGYDIPEITDSVIKGYEDICLGNGDYLVPYLYPCTAKLHQAALNAAADGYSLRIYDAFRPNESTRYLYDTVEMLMDEPVVEEGGESGEETTQAAPLDGEPDVVQEEDLMAGMEPAQEGDPELSEEVQNTYRTVMTDNGRYRLGSFLAASVSAHNRGIALDLVLIDADTKEDLLMQSDMHDLSWYSALARNNDNARLLAEYMKGVGYNDLSSEWWHFQDDETRNEIGLNSYLTTGVSVEGWKRDDTGWRYRLKDGSFYQEKTVLIDGEEYTFDEEGYCAGNSFSDTP